MLCAQKVVMAIGGAIIGLMLSFTLRSLDEPAKGGGGQLTASTEKARVRWVFRGEQVFGITFAPAMKGGFLYWCAGSSVYCLDSRDGSVLWEKKGSATLGPPVTLGEGVLLSDVSGRVVCLDERGTEIWKHRVEGVGTLATDQHSVFCLSEVGVVRSWSAVGEERWRRSLKGKTMWVPVIDDKKVFLVTSRGVWALRSLDGEPMWHYPLREDENVLQYRFPIVSNGRLYVPLEGRMLVLFAETGRIDWDKDLGEGLYAVSPFCLSEERGILFCASAKLLYALEANFPGTRWRTDLGSDGSACSPFLLGGMVWANVVPCNIHGEDVGQAGALLVGFDADSGNRLVEVRIPTTATASTVSGNTAYIGCAGGYCVALEVSGR